MSSTQETIMSADLSDWRVAKREAMRLATAIGAVLGQTEHGKPRVYKGAARKDFCTWLAAWTWLQRIHADMVRAPPVAMLLPPTARPVPQVTSVRRATDADRGLPVAKIIG